jgi:hypothetical protein
LAASKPQAAKTAILMLVLIIDLSGAASRNRRSGSMIDAGPEAGRVKAGSDA